LFHGCERKTWATGLFTLAEKAEIVRGKDSPVCFSLSHLFLILYPFQGLNHIHEAKRIQVDFLTVDRIWVIRRDLRVVFDAGMEP
jgi:hypothetical protein